MTDQTYNNALRWLTLIAYAGAIVSAFIALAEHLWK